MEEVHPYALRGPADIPVIEGLARAIDGRRVNPAGARLQHMDDAADHPPIVDARLASRVRRQVRCDPRELPIRQPEMIAIHRRLSLGAVNHKTIRTGSGLMGPNPSEFTVAALRRQLPSPRTGGRR